MAQYQNHISFSTLVAFCYAGAGYYFFSIFPENLILAGIIIIITGMLPDIDAGQSAPARELASLLAALAPVVLLEMYPSLRTGGSSRVILVVIVAYVITRLLVVRVLQEFTVHRGMIHSIPAAIILFEIIYIVLGDIYWMDRLYLAGAVFVGYMSHLVLDGYGNLDLVGSALGKGGGAQAALKLVGRTWGITIFLYVTILILGYYIARDFPLKEFSKVRHSVQKNITKK